MSITCSKEYTLTLVAAVDPTLLSYYPCEHASGAASSEDVAGSFDLLQGAGMGSALGKIGNGFKAFGAAITAANNATWDFGGKSLTIRFWYFAQDNTELGDTSILQLNKLGNDFQIYRFGSGVDGIEFTVKSIGANQDFSATGIVVGAWNRIIAWHEHGVGFGLKINNNASVTQADASGLNAGARWLSLRLENLPVGTPAVMDEIAIWNRKLTEVEMTHDWNSGTGRTYPNVP